MFLKYTYRAITSLQWHAMAGIAIYRTPEEHTHHIMFHRQTNNYHAMKGIV